MAMKREDREQILEGIVFFDERHTDGAQKLCDFLNKHSLWGKMEIVDFDTGSKRVAVSYGTYRRNRPGRKSLQHTFDSKYNVTYGDILDMRDAGLKHDQIIAKIGWSRATYFRAWKNRGGLERNDRFAWGLGWFGAELAAKVSDDDNGKSQN